MTDNRPIDPLVSGMQSALLHFGKAVFEVVSGVGILVEAVIQTARPGDDGAEDGSGGRQKIEIE